MRVFKTKWFARFARRVGIVDSKLAVTVREIEKGLIDADYGGGLIKKRVARDGAGKSGGYRSIIAYRSEEKCVFMYCFAKSDKGNLNINEVAQYKNAADIYLGFNEIAITVSTRAYIPKNKTHKYQWDMSLEYRKTYVWVLSIKDGRTSGGYI